LSDDLPMSGTDIDFPIDPPAPPPAAPPPPPLSAPNRTCGEKMGIIDENSIHSSENHDVRSPCGEKMGFIDENKPKIQ
jgi:hypothetical protein